VIRKGDKTIYRIHAVPAHPVPGDEYLSVVIEMPASTRSQAVSRARRLFPSLYVSRLERIAILSVPAPRKAKQ
jgi:hypothetical protein